MRRRGLTVLLGALFTALLSIGVLRVPIPYVVLGPGPTVNTLGTADGKEVIQISGRETSTSAGQLRLTTVGVQPTVRLRGAIAGWFSDDEAVVPRELVYPPGESTEQVEQRNAEDFKVSQTSAETAALRELGFPVQVVIKTVAADGPSAGVLKVGDVITSVDGKPVPVASKVTELVRAKRAGAALTIGYTRDGAPATATVTSQEQDGRPRIGVEIDQQQPHPFTLGIDLEDIGGPSAGLMFALGIVDKLTPADLTGGQVIAGTGTIDDEGNVGPIGGIAQKLVGAKRAGAKVFLVPADNCAEAVRNPQPDLPLLRVGSLDEGLTALETLRAGDSRPAADACDRAPPRSGTPRTLGAWSEPITFERAEPTVVMRSSSPLPRMSRRGRVTIAVLVGVFVLFTLLGWGVQAWTDWLWFDEVRYTEVFTGVLVTRLLLFLAVGLGMAVIVGGNLWLAHRLRPRLRPHSVEQATLERYRMVLSPRLGTWIALTAAVVGLFAGLSAQSRWNQWLLFRNGGDFGIKDPEFGVDIGFYVFQLPFWRYLLGVAFTAVVLAVIGALAVHYLFGGVRLQGVGDRMSNAARAHLSSLVAVFVLLKSVAYVLDRRAMLLEYNEGAKLYGAGYADVNALLPAKEILAYISIVVAIAIVVFSNAWMRNLVWPGISLALLGVSAVAIGGIYPWAVQTFEVKPSAKDKEAPYIQRSIDATRAAFGLGATETTPYAASNLTPPANLATDTSVVSNVRLLDPQLVSETYTQLQQVRGFYDFGPKLDIDRYGVNGKISDYVVGVREINYGELTDQQNTWINRHTVYTHGYGLVAAPANQVVCGGQPFFVSGFLGERTQEACSSQTEQIPAKQPRIYYGERMAADDYAIVGQSDPNKKAEFDRPVGEGGGESYTYTGEGGVEIGSFTRRLLYAIKEQESNFLLSEAVNKDSKLLYVRNPRDRVEKVAPFLTLDGDPYPAVVDGRVQWIVDGYTTAATYPYAERVNLQTETTDELTNRGTFQLARENVNYMRNSVKATVDAYDGTVKLYEYDDTDPVLKAWNKAFGGDLVLPKAEIPVELTEHLRYPADMFKVQRNLLTKFHVTNPGDFYSAQDFWQVPNVPDAPDSGQKQPPYYLFTQFPGQESPRFQLTSAVTPNGRQNLAALISGSYVEGRPRLEVLELPDQTRISGPVQVHQQMTNNANIRQQLNLLSSNQAQVQYGNLLSLPFADGMLYVEPVYVKSNQQDAYPLLQKVLLSYGDGGSFVALADNINDGIKQLVEQGKRAGQAAPPPPTTGGNPTTPPPSPGPGTPPMTGELADAANRVQTAITEVRAAQTSGDFERYGRALKALDEALTAFQQAQQAANPPASPGGSPSPSGSAPPPPSPTTGAGG